MKIKRMVLGGLANNTYIIIGEEGKKAVVIDPAAEPERILEYLSGQGLALEGILITHGHYDHIGAVEGIKRHLDVPVYTHEEEARMMEDPIRNLSTYFTSMGIKAQADKLVVEGEILSFGDDLSFKTIIVPGHSPKSVCFLAEDQNVVFTGDTLFSGSIGRTDYYNGDQGDLIRYISQKLMFLPGDTKVYPGHGEMTTIANEKAYNPYLR